MNYALGYAFNIHDMFANFDTSKLDLETIVFKTNDGITVNFVKVEGHSDNVGNNRADELAVKAKAMT